MRRYINKAVVSYYNWLDPTFLRSIHPYYDKVLRDDNFDLVHEELMAKTGTPFSQWRRDRFYNLVQSFNLVSNLEGAVAECGAWKGLSSNLLCNKIKSQNKSYRGENYHIFDSFEGLSKPTENDSNVPDDFTGMFTIDIDLVKKSLEDYPSITFHKGWIPEVFTDVKDVKYKFVHIDVDLADPTIESFKYFYPKLVNR